MLAGLCPKLSGEPQCLVGQGQISARVNLHEGIETSEPRSLTCAEQFAPQFVVNDGRHQHGVAVRKPVDEPAVQRHDLRREPRLRHESERARIQQKVAAHGKTGLSGGRFAFRAALNWANSCSARAMAAESSEASSRAHCWRSAMVPELPEAGVGVTLFAGSMESTGFA